jgi:nicotinamide riboside transporter PnuC
VPTAHPGAHLIAAAAVLLAAVGLMAAVRNRVIRRRLLFSAAAALAMAGLTAVTLAAWSDAAAPWADALGTWTSVAATWLMIRKVAANWLWWIVVDAGLAALFASQGLFFTAVLYLAFATLAAAGWFAWRAAPQVA